MANNEILVNNRLFNINFYFDILYKSSNTQPLTAIKNIIGNHILNIESDLIVLFCKEGGF